jgi:hypothetical protein
MSKEQSSQIFNFRLLVMKRMSFCFLVLFASFILAVQSFGQISQSDSVKTDLNLSSVVVNKLDNKDIVEIIEYREKLVQEKEMAKMHSPNLTSESTATIWSILIGIFILSLFVIPYYFNFKKAKTRQLIITKLIEKDIAIPKELLAKPKKTRRSDLHNGIVYIAFGLSLCIVIFILRIHSNFWTIGLIPMFIGIGYVISFKLDHSIESKSEID